MNDRDIEGDDDNTIAVVWYDGNQRCKVFNVLPMQCARETSGNTVITNDIDNVSNGSSSNNNACSCCRHDKNSNNNNDNDTTKTNNSSVNHIAIGIDNDGYHPTDEDDPGCSRTNDHSSIIMKDDEDPDSKDVSSKTCTCGLPSSTDDIRMNSEFKLNELSNETDQSYDRSIACACPMAPAGLDQDSHLFPEGLEPSETSEEQPSSNTNINEIAEDRNDINDPFQQNHPARTCSDAVVVCNVCHNEISLTTKPASVEEEEPPPQYSSLRYLFLADEPPKYQDVTGKALTSANIPVRHRLLSEPVKRRLVIGCVVVFFLLIGALLVYACFVSGHPLGSYGSAPRKF